MSAAARADIKHVRSTAPDSSRRIIAFTAAAMYGAAAIDGLIETALPNTPHFSMLPIIVVIAMCALLVTVGPHLPRRVIMFAGPLGVGLVGYALATTNVRASDSAVLFALPVVWQSLFFGRRGAIIILVFVAVADALALHALGPFGYPERWVDVMVSAIAIAIVVRALEERNQRLLESLSLEAREDPLTGLLNRRGFDERAAVELRRLRRDPEPFSLATFDVDHFKLVNDEWGHDVGDRVLRHIATLLRAQARNVDVVSRFGGEEFMVLLPGTDVFGARAFADRVRMALAQDHGGLPPVRLSAGVRAGSEGADLTTLVAEADSALYDAKRSGRDQTRVFAAA